jgi:hypothetical protein
MRNFTIWHWRPRRRLRRRDCAATIVIAIVGINSTERLAHLLGAGVPALAVLAVSLAHPSPPSMGVTIEPPRPAQPPPLNFARRMDRAATRSSRRQAACDGLAPVPWAG